MSLSPVYIAPAFTAEGERLEVRVLLLRSRNLRYSPKLRYCARCQSFFEVLDEVDGARIHCPFCNIQMRYRPRKKAFKWEKAINPEAIP